MSDCEDAPLRPSKYRPMPVESIGEVMALKPAPSSAAAMALACHPEISDASRTGYIGAFVYSHVQPGEVDRLMVQMLDAGSPEDTMMRLAVALATWGTARPYLAVGGLCVNTAQHWRRIRAHLINSGISDPMCLTSLHALLDVVESMLEESIANNADSSDAATRDVGKLRDNLYAPHPAFPAPRSVIDDERKAADRFTDEESSNSFDAFLSAAR